MNPRGKLALGIGAAGAGALFFFSWDGSPDAPLVFEPLRSKLAGAETMKVAFTLRYVGITHEEQRWLFVADRAKGWSLEPLRGLPERAHWNAQDGATSWHAVLRTPPQPIRPPAGTPDDVFVALWDEVGSGFESSTWTEVDAPPLDGSLVSVRYAWARVDPPYAWAEGFGLYLGVERASGRWIGAQLTGFGDGHTLSVAECTFDEAIPSAMFSSVRTATERPGVPAWDERLVRSDRDRDRVRDDVDNCPYTTNPDQLDSDGDAWGDLCDGDADGDGQADDPHCAAAATRKHDSDRDGLPDACDLSFDVDPLAAAIRTWIADIDERIREQTFDTASLSETARLLDVSFRAAIQDIESGGDGRAGLAEAAGFVRTLALVLDREGFGADRRIRPSDTRFFLRRTNDLSESLEILAARG